jgi:hypothetical protein
MQAQHLLHFGNLPSSGELAENRIGDVARQ